MKKELDILDILDISHREDSITNVIKYLFDNNNDFRIKLSKKFLNTQEINDIEDLTLLTRKAFIPKSNGKIIPDMVLYSENLNRISIIEVKITSGQGTKQLERYEDGMDIIIESLKLDSNMKKGYYYLSINNDSIDDKGWEFVSWSNMGEIFKVNSSREDINYIINAILARINNIKAELIYDEVKKEPFNDHLKLNLWKFPDKAIKEIFSSNENYSAKLKDFSISYYTRFAPAKNTTQTNIYISKEGWKGKLDYDDEGSSINNCFDFHIEIRMSVDDEKSDMEIRLDHHLNPYKPNKDMKNFERYEEFYNSKKKYIEEMKFNKYKDLLKAKEGRGEKYRFNKANGYYLWIIKKDEEIKNKKTVEEVMGFLIDDIEWLSEQVEVFKDELINFKCT